MPDPVQTDAYTPPSQAGDHIGPYKLLQQLGHGGMGEVWMAEQSHPVHRRVAIKLIKAGMDSRAVLARFEAERQALAMMDHPNIAKVLDAGATDNGRPYFVMELVKGIPLVKYCDQEHLTPRERLELFIPVCQAVQHAHQKGIIHRDLKPSNIIVGLYDGKPVPKVIDFGIAKATHQKLSEQTLFTEIGQIIGTLAYMAPEQAELNNLDIDTRADIYSLGVILYELLAGSPPFSAKQLREAGFDEARRVIREVEPQKPSTKLSSSDQLPSLAAARKLEPKRLTNLLRGELDWVVMKCLEKDRARRYETANGLSMDIQRYLTDEPVLAGPPSKVYRIRKFVRRNKAGVIAASLVLVTLLAGIAGTSWGMWRATEERRKAVAQEIETGKERDRAEAEKETTKAVLDFVEEKVFAAARPKDQDGGQGFDVKLADAIKAALPFVEKSFVKQPLVEARLRMTLGTSFQYLGDGKTAAEQYQSARDLYRQKLGPDHPDTLRSMNNLALSYAALGRQADALKLREETLALRKIKLGPDHRDTLRSMQNLASSYAALGRHADALKLCEDTVALQKIKLGPDHPDTLSSMNSLAVSYADLGRHADALKLHKETLALQKIKLGPDHPDTLSGMNNVASSFYLLGQHADALKLHEETLALQRIKLGPDHPNTLSGMNNVASSYAALGRHADALKLREETLRLKKNKLGPEHRDTLLSMNNLANSYYALGRRADALTLYEETLALQKTKLGPEHRDTLLSMNNLAISYAALARHADALKLFEETLALRRIKYGPDHRDTLLSMNGLAGSYAALGRHADALKLLEESLALQKNKLGLDHPATLRSMHNLAIIYAALGRHADALKLREETLVLQRAKLGADHPDTLLSMNNLATSCYRLGRHAEALKLFEETLTIRKGKPGSNYPDTVNTVFSIACDCSLMIAKADDRAKQAEIAMDWLKQAVAAGYKNVAHMKKVKDLDALRDRPDFKKLIADLEAKVAGEKKDKK